MVFRTTFRGKPERSEWWETAWFWNRRLFETEPPEHLEYLKERSCLAEASVLYAAPGKVCFGLQFNYF